MRGIPDDRDTLCTRQKLLQDFQALGFQVSRQHGVPGEVASRPRKVGDDLLHHRISGDEDDRHRRGRGLDRARGHRAARAENDLGFQREKLVDERGQLVDLVGPAKIDDEIAAFDIAKIGESCAECRDVRRVRAAGPLLMYAMRCMPGAGWL